MAIDSEATFLSTFEDVPLVDTIAWAGNISDWYDERIDEKAIAIGLSHTDPPFIFSNSNFQTQLELIEPESDQASAAENIADAWENAINNSDYITVPNDYLSPGGDANTWSVVSSSLIDSSSISSAKSQLISDLTNAPLVNDPSLSELPTALRSAIINLTISVLGSNKVVPPVPLNVSGIGLE